MIRSPAIAATSSRGGSKNCTRIEGVRCKRLAKVRCRSVLASDQPIHLTSKTITAVSIPRSIPSSVHSPRLRFRSRRSRRLHRFHCSKAGPFRMCSVSKWSDRSRPERLRCSALMSSFEFWHSLVASANRGYLSTQDPSRMPGHVARGRHRMVNRERNS
jgi:hypothetical protein